MAALSTAIQDKARRAARGGRDGHRRDGFDFEAAHARLNAYRSRLSRLSPEARKAVLTDQGPEAAGVPHSYDK